MSQFKDIIRERADNSGNFIITNEKIYGIYKPVIEQIFGNSPILTIKDGEKYKNFKTIVHLSEQLLSLGANRNSLLWAFGGGVVGDMTGFLASIFMRGISYCQIPTTLLSMVDSSVGGKTGVNIENGKNMIGTFYQPSGVYIHVNFLKTLDLREFKCGMSEIIKSALLDDLDLFQLMENNLADLRPDNEIIMEQLSMKSVKVKSRIVMEDEKEAGLRAILNLGHTLAHALESNYNYRFVKHGEAVSIGTTFASFLSMEKGFITNDEFRRICNIFHKLRMNSLWDSLPRKKPDVNTLVNFMKGDKKNSSQKIKFVLLNGIGKYKLPSEIEDEFIINALEKYKCLKK